jgi:hypothetical protein
MSNSEGNKLRKFEVVAFGCHDRAHRNLAGFLQSRGEGIHTFSFIEYFCVAPIPLARWENAWESTKLFFPFIRRIVEEDQFLWVPDGRESFQLVPKTSDIKKEFNDPAQFILSPSLPLTRTGYRVLEWWVTYGRWLNRAAEAVKHRPILTYTREAWLEHLSSVLNGPTVEKEISLKEYGLAAQPWAASPRNSQVFGFPIATDSIFYGYFILILPEQSDEEKGKAIREEVWGRLGKLADDLYLPVLTVFAESLMEKDLSKQIGSAVKDRQNWKSVADAFMGPDRVPFLRCAEDGLGESQHKNCPARERPYSKEIERPLHCLWVRRKKMLSKLEDGKDFRWTFQDTLAFGKYFVASPGLIDQLKLVMGASITMAKDRESLPAALVYGGPGSGKEVLARLAPLFSPDYFFSDIHTVNMAAVRPDAITGPLLQGIKLTHYADDDQDRPTRIGLEGLLVEAKKYLKTKPGEGGDNTGKDGATFILDELNSIDVDLQGILLRILEQGEVMPLFGLEKKYVRHFIVGIVNEDPEEISRESELRDLLVEKGKLGTLISAFLYEAFRRTRRLREDLYHRLKRQLYLRVPSMKDRPEDIPMLFYLFACDEAKETKEAEEVDVIVDLNAYRLLMHPHIPWPGNIRQVQSVARCSIRRARRAQEALGASSVDGVLIVSHNHVLYALKDEFPGIPLDAGVDEKDRQRDLDTAT